MKIVGIGELIWDAYPNQQRAPGGAPANCIYHAVQLGHQGVIVSRLGKDAMGAEMAATLREFGLETQYLQWDPIHATASVQVWTDVNGEAHYRCDQISRAFDFLTFTPELTALSQSAQAIVFSALGQRNPTAAATIQQFLTTPSSAFKLFDFNVHHPTDWMREIWCKSLPVANGLKANASEFQTLQTMLGHSGATPEETVKLLQNQYPLDLILVTMGANGSKIYLHEADYETVPPATNIVDTNGCGDAYTIAALIAFLEHASLPEIGARGNQLAAQVAGRTGATQLTP
ncbi:PfkB family carbohydrate kinase [candidate division KSB1 bacterium]|nr:PfkB family carbohydrate kinase [candidate division KSB1 bacterium]